jgi:hypothetical protein
MVTRALKMEIVRFSETLAYTNQSTRRLNPEEQLNTFSKFKITSFSLVMLGCIDTTVVDPCLMNLVFQLKHNFKLRLANVGVCRE